MKFLCFLLLLVLPFEIQCKDRPIDAIKNVIIIIMENWSFDGMFGLMKGVDGVSPENYVVQVDKVHSFVFIIS
jgi:phospholipase C